MPAARCQTLFAVKCNRKRKRVDLLSRGSASSAGIPGKDAPSRDLPTTGTSRSEPAGVSDTDR